MLETETDDDSVGNSDIVYLPDEVSLDNSVELVVVCSDALNTDVCVSINVGLRFADTLTEARAEFDVLVVLETETDDEGVGNCDIVYLPDDVSVGNTVGLGVVCSDALNTDVCVVVKVGLEFAVNDTLGEPLSDCAGVKEGLFDGDICADSDALVNAVTVGPDETDADCDSVEVPVICVLELIETVEVLLVDTEAESVGERVDVLLVVELTLCVVDSVDVRVPVEEPD